MNMKKILLGTTTLIGAAGLFAGAALADTPKVTIGGYENFQLGVESDDLDSGSRAKSGSVKERPDAFRSDTQVTFRIDGKTDAGLGYGGGIDLLADTSADVRDHGVNASKTFIYLDGNWGRLELGSNVGAEGTMKVDAATIARATGGIDGDFVYYANSRAQFLATPDLPLAYGPLGAGNGLGDAQTENLNKVTYYTPRFAGFQLGVSFLPDEVNRGEGFTGGTTLSRLPVSTTIPLGPDRADAVTGLGGLAQNIVTGGASYDNKFGDYGLTVAGTGEYGNSTSYLYDDLKAWNAGAKVTAWGASIAGSYGNTSDSNRLRSLGVKDDGNTGTYYWTAGAAYEFGPFGASVTYLNSKYDNGNSRLAGATTGHNNFDDISVGVDYKLAPGLTPYAEVTLFNEDPSASAQAAAVGSIKNRGTVGIVGTQLAF